MPFITINDIRWKQILDKTSFDVYHLQGFASMEAKLLKGEAFAWWHEINSKTILIPLICRNIPYSDYVDLISPYGYPGILTSSSLLIDELSETLNLFNEEAIQKSYISSFIRLNPLINSWNIPQQDNWLQLKNGTTVSINLRKDYNSIIKNYSENHKRNINRLHHLSYSFTINNWDYLKDFASAYIKTMRRSKAQSYYFFPPSYFNGLQSLLKEKLIFISILNGKGVFVAGGIFSIFNGVMQYHLGATTNDALSMSPSKLMMDAAIIEGQKKEAKILHLGGGYGGRFDDGLFRFKSGFGNTLHEFSTLRMIHRLDVYEDLVNSKIGSQNGSNGFFPEYRTPSTIIETV
jgi:hypothetical protein